MKKRIFKKKIYGIKGISNHTKELIVFNRNESYGGFSVGDIIIHNDTHGKFKAIILSVDEEHVYIQYINKSIGYITLYHFEIERVK